MAALSTPEAALARPRVSSAERAAISRQLGLMRLWEPLALAAILLLAGGLSLVGLDRQGYGNTYYAAAVESMLTSWHAFFFASFDAGGFVAVDKPPLGLWVQAASAWLFGFSGPSLFLPQIASGLASVGLVYWLVRRSFGPAAGLLAGLALAVTPINAVTNRNNTMDSLLVLVLLLAGGAATLAAERGRLGWLLASAALVGLGYNVKMLQAYPVVPAFGLMYVLFAPIRRRARLGHLALAGAVLLAVSLSWSAVVDLTPATARPYVGSSGSNSALSLALGYNGLGRVVQALSSRIPVPELPGLTIDLSQAPAFAPQIGQPGLARLLRPGVADQASWLLPLALLGLIVAGWQARRSALDLEENRGVAYQGGHAGPPLPENIDRGGHEVDRRRVALVLWGGWLVAWAAYFTVARFYHLYYLVMLGPAVAALSGIAVVALWRAYDRGGWGLWLLPLGLLGTAALQQMIAADSPTWSGQLGAAIGVLGLVAALALTALRWVGTRWTALVAAGICALALLVMPSIWADRAVLEGQGGAWLPQAGPTGPDGFARFGQGGPPGGFGQQDGRGGPRGNGAGPFGGPSSGGSGFGQAPGVGFGPGPGGGALTFAGEQWNSLDPGLVRYLLANQGNARYLVATPTSSYASLFILATDQPVMALGGYQGWDRILTPSQLAEQVRSGVVRFFYLNGGGFGRGGADATSDLTSWVQAGCTAVPAERWRASTSNAGAFAGRGGQGVPVQQLYDCAAVATPNG